MKQETPSPLQTQNPNLSVDEADNIKENDAPELASDKKTDELIDPNVKQPGLLWRMSSGIYGTAAGAVGLGVGGVKWVADKSYTAGTTVLSTSKTVVSKVPIPTLKKKDKKE